MVGPSRTWTFELRCCSGGDLWLSREALCLLAAERSNHQPPILGALIGKRRRKVPPPCRRSLSQDGHVQQPHRRMFSAHGTADFVFRLNGSLGWDILCLFDDPFPGLEGDCLLAPSVNALLWLISCGCLVMVATKRPKDPNGHRDLVLCPPINRERVLQPPTSLPLYPRQPACGFPGGWCHAVLPAVSPAAQPILLCQLRRMECFPLCRSSGSSLTRGPGGTLSLTVTTPPPPCIIEV